jgi:hypothetical protein
MANPVTPVMSLITWWIWRTPAVGVAGNPQPPTTAPKIPPHLLFSTLPVRLLHIPPGA